MIAEILGPDGSVHYRRSYDDPLVAEAKRTLGYSVRLVEGDYETEKSREWAARQAREFANYDEK